MKQILVLDSLMWTMFRGVPRLPVTGDTLHGEGLKIFVGGKGPKQVCAAASSPGVQAVQQFHFAQPAARE